MLSNILKRHQRVLASTAVQSFQQVPVRHFSQPTAEEAAKKREEWGEQYSDECFTFEKEWKLIADKIEKE